MFGFQRTGDQFWQFADQLGRGFVLGATAGRTTLTGEGLQHADGHSLLLASTNPAAVAYDPAFAFEIAHIVRDGLRRMYAGGPNGTGEDIFYYLTIYNEPIVQPAEPENVDVEGILRGMHRYSPALGVEGRPRAQVLASGVAMPWALRAQRLLGEEWGVDADVWSVTSWNELRRDAVDLRGGQPAGSVGRSSSAVRGGPARRYLGTGGRGVRLHARRAGSDFPVGARLTTPRWARTVSDLPTRGAQRGASSTSTPNRSCWPCLPLSPSAARSSRRHRARRSTGTSCST